MIANPESELSEFQDEVGEWGKKTFDPTDQLTNYEFAKGRINHFLKESEELKEEFLKHPYPQFMNNMGSELADCFLLLLHISDLMYFDLLKEARKKMEINRKRKWKEPDEFGVIEHIKNEYPTS